MFSEERVTGEVDLTEMYPLWELLSQLDKEASAAGRRFAADPTLMSDRRFDEAQPAGPRTYIQAAAHLNAARTCHAAFRDSLSVGIRPHSTWAALRPTLECSFYTVWILEPDDQRTRLWRGLRVEWHQHRSRKARWNLRKALLQAKFRSDDPSYAERDAEIAANEETFKQEAHRLHLAPAKLKEHIDVSREIGKLESLGDLEEDFPGIHELVWRELSQAVHGDAGALLTMSESHERHQIPGGERHLLSVDDDALLLACRVAGHMQLRALTLYRDRTLTYTGQDKPAPSASP